MKKNITFGSSVLLKSGECKEVEIKACVVRCDDHFWPELESITHQDGSPVDESDLEDGEREELESQASLLSQGIHIAR